MHVRVPRHVARLVIDYFTSRRLVVDYSAYAARPGASARRVARRRLLRLHRASGCLGTSHGSSSTTLPTPRIRAPWYIARLVAWLVVDYFAYVVRFTVARLIAQLVVNYFAYAVRLALARLVSLLIIDYFAYTARPGASARCMARCQTLRL
jgi:hypothetical protein